MNASEALTGAIVRDVFLWPAMDARAANVEQDQLLFNPTPGVDSLFEHLEQIAGAVPRSSLGELVTITTRISASNRAEAGFELGIAGSADQLARDLHDRERNGGGRPTSATPLTAKAIARRLRSPIQLLAHPSGVATADLFEASRTISRTIRTVPRLQLLSPAVAHELGRAKYEQLCELVDLEKTGAARLEAAGAVARGSSHGPG